ncbi:MAG: hypothetical protein GAK41_00651 [Burkholderia gladioli]|nr:MAG: hypothetical protein GAK41_00651 [Burkholderia gladioli]
MPDVLDAGHRDVFPADEGESVAEAFAPASAGYAGLYAAVQDADWMMQSASQTAFVH